MSWVTRVTALMPSTVGGTLMSSGSPVSTVSLRCRREISGPAPEVRRRLATVTVRCATGSHRSGRARRNEYAQRYDRPPAAHESRFYLVPPRRASVVGRWPVQGRGDLARRRGLEGLSDQGQPGEDDRQPATVRRGR